MFSVSALQKTVRIYDIEYPPPTHLPPSVLATISIGKEYTVYKYKDSHDEWFEKLSKQFDPRWYHLFSIHEDCPGIYHIGIVHFLSGLFSDAGIPILYMNSYASNLVLISEEHVKEAIELMKSHSRILFDSNIE